MLGIYNCQSYLKIFKKYKKDKKEERQINTGNNDLHLLVLIYGHLGLVFSVYL
jgi:hypothetical protein